MSNTSFITYRINGTTLKLLDLKGFQGKIDTQSTINWKLKFAKSKSTQTSLSEIVNTNKIPENIKPDIKIISGQNYDLKENEFWLTLDELNKQKRFVVNLVNRTDSWCIAGLKKSITKDYFDQTKGYVCIHGPSRGNKIETDETPEGELFHPDFKLGHRLVMYFNEKVFEQPLIEIEFSIEKTVGTDELQKIVESQILTTNFQQKVYPENTFDEECCVICNDNKEENPELSYTIFMPCKHSIVCTSCSKEARLARYANRKSRKLSLKERIRAGFWSR